MHFIETKKWNTLCIDCRTSSIICAALMMPHFVNWTNNLHANIRKLPRHQHYMITLGQSVGLLPEMNETSQTPKLQFGFTAIEENVTNLLGLFSWENFMRSHISDMHCQSVKEIAHWSYFRMVVVWQHIVKTPMMSHFWHNEGKSKCVYTENGFEPYLYFFKTHFSTKYEFHGKNCYQGLRHKKT